MDSLRPALIAGARQLGVALSDAQSDTLLQYLAEFARWNRAYNLSAVRDPAQMLPRHLLDSLSVVPWLRDCPAARIIDVGSGGGLPGLVLAVLFPERQFTLLDSNGKKTRFLFHCVTTLALNNVTVEHRRVEDWTPPERFDLVISRAFASLQDMTRLCRHLLTENGLFLAMKGVYPEQELAALGDDVELLEHRQLQVPDTDGERCLLVFRPR